MQSTYEMFHHTYHFQHHHHQHNHHHLRYRYVSHHLYMFQSLLIQAKEAMGLLLLLLLLQICFVEGYDVFWIHWLWKNNSWILVFSWVQVQVQVTVSLNSGIYIYIYVGVVWVYRLAYTTICGTTWCNLVCDTHTRAISSLFDLNFLIRNNEKPFNPLRSPPPKI